MQPVIHPVQDLSEKRSHSAEYTLGILSLHPGAISLRALVVDELEFYSGVVSSERCANVSESCLFLKI